MLPLRGKAPGISSRPAFLCTAPGRSFRLLVQCCRPFALVWIQGSRQPRRGLPPQITCSVPDQALSMTAGLSTPLGGYLETSLFTPSLTRTSAA